MATSHLTGGAAVAKALQKVQANLVKANQVNIGFLGKSTYPDGTPTATIAARNEYGGTSTIQARQQTINRQLSPTGSGAFLRKGRFVTLSQSNYQTSHPVASYTVVTPPRPFFRSMISSNSGSWGTSLTALMKQYGQDSAKALNAMGMLIKGQLEASILAFTSPALSPRTIARKGFDKPLIETSHMLKSMDYEVK